MCPECGSDNVRIAHFDFDAATKKISPVAGFAWDASDLVLADYQY